MRFLIIATTVSLLIAGPLWGFGRGGGGGMRAGGGAYRGGASFDRGNFNAGGYRPGNADMGGYRPGNADIGGYRPGNINTGGYRTDGFNTGAYRPANTIRPAEARPQVINFQPSPVRKPDGAVFPARFDGHGADGGLATLSRQWDNTHIGSNTFHVDRNTINNTGVRVRNNYRNVNVFNDNWWRNHPNGWRPAVWFGAGAYWGWANWANWSAFGGYPPTPVYYDYGTNVVYQNNVVYVNGDNVGTPQQYAEQAVTLANTGRQAQPAEKDQWMSLGVFAMVQGTEQSSNNLFQLAVNKAGVIRGNFYNQLTNNTLPVYGQVDQKTQRAAWTVGDNKDVVYEAGAANLTQDQTTMLVHMGANDTQQWTLVRLPEPTAAAPGSNNP